MEPSKEFPYKADKPNATRSFGKIADLLIVFAAINIIPRLSTFLTNLIYPYIGHLDRDQVFLWITVHHIFQLLLTLVAMKLYFQTSYKEWGFNLKNLNLSLKISLYFFIFFIIFQGLPIIVGLVTGRFIQPDIAYPLTGANMAGHLSFQGLLSGTCEEPLFRGFAIVILSQSWTGRIKIGRIDISAANIIAAVFFSYAHIGFTIFPFALTRLYLPQIVVSFLLGIIYGIVFEKTKSLLGPILLHNMSNLVSISSGYITYMLIS